MVPDDMHDFFVAAAGVAGALIGLLFVAISVVGDKLSSRADGPLHRVRAAAALTSFTNALVVSLLALVPGDLAHTAVAVAVVGLVFVAGAILSLRSIRTLRWAVARDLFFLVGLIALFATELGTAIDLIGNPRPRSDVSTLAVLVVVCFLVGIARAWELIGGPSIGLGSEAVGLSREVLQRQRDEDARPGPTP